MLAQKNTDAEIMQCYEVTFSKDYGLSLLTLAGRFENRMYEIETKTQELMVVFNSRYWRISKRLRCFISSYKWIISEG